MGGEDLVCGQIGRGIECKRVAFKRSPVKRSRRVWNGCPSSFLLPPSSLLLYLNGKPFDIHKEFIFLIAVLHGIDNKLLNAGTV